jgi:hypothetical protein
MSAKRIAFLIYGDSASTRNALTEEKYRELAETFSLQQFEVDSIVYNDESADQLFKRLLQYKAVLVWINPIEQGRDRKKLDALLIKLADGGCFVSAHPAVILKMGTKDVLYKTRDMDWGGDVKMYTSNEEFIMKFPIVLRASGTRVLKQHRGNGGNGVYKIRQETADRLTVIHAKNGDQEKSLSLNEFFEEFNPFFANNGLLIDQPWNENISNGMVRCYSSGTRVAGFGYQEINALYEIKNSKKTYSSPAKRYYFTGNCGLFNDLKEIMETKWIPHLQKLLSIPAHELPVIWDADFFINGSDKAPSEKYSLCEINVSCVSPFPPSAIPFIVNLVKDRIS